MDKWPRLTGDGYELTFRLNEIGVDVTPDEVADGLEEAAQRITGGPCKGCGVEDEDLRFGWCFDCVTKAEAEAGITEDTPKVTEGKRLLAEVAEAEGLLAERRREVDAYNRHLGITEDTE